MTSETGSSQAASAGSTGPSNPFGALARGIWWLVLVRGIIAIIFGIIALLAPGAALTGIAIVFGAYALVDGIVAIVHAIAGRGTVKAWGWLLFQGVVAVIAGLVALVFPGFAGAIGGLLVLWVIAIFAIMHGVGGVLSAVRSPASRNRTIGIVAGALTIVVGIVYVVLILAVPGVTLLGFIWLIGAYAIIFGVMLIVAAVRLRRVFAAA